MPVCVGCGLFVNGSGLLEVQLRPSGGLACDPDGVDAGLYTTAATVTGSSSIDVVGGVVSINRSEDACNAIELRGNGLFAPCPEGVAFIDNSASPQQGDIPVTMVGNGNTYAFESNLITITNTSVCCTIAGVVSFQTGFVGTLDAGAKLSAEMDISTNGAAYVSSSPATYELFHNLHATDALSWASNLYDQVYASFAPSEVKTFKSKAIFTLITGPGTGGNDGTITSGATFETQWTLVPTSCGC